MKKIHLVIFLLMSYISVAQDLTIISGGSITIPKDSYVFVGGEWTTPFGASAINKELKGYPERDDLFSKKGEQLGRRVRDAVLRWNAK